MTILFLLLFIAVPCLADPGDGGLGDSTINKIYTHGLDQAAGVGEVYRDESGHLLFSAGYLFDMAVDAHDTVYTRGEVNLYDSTWWGDKAWNSEDWIGHYCHVMLFTGTDAASVLDIRHEESPLPDSTTFQGSGSNSGWNMGWYTTRQLFGGTVAGVANGTVVLDSFYVSKPYNRLRLIETDSSNTGDMQIMFYLRRPPVQYSAPNGEYGRIKSGLRGRQRDASRY